MSLANVRQKMADTINTGITTLKCSPYVIDSFNAGQAVIDVTGPDEYTLDGGNLAAGAYRYTFMVRVYFGATVEAGSQALMDTLRDPTQSTSLKQVLESSSSAMAPYVQYVRVGGGSGIGQVSPSEGNTYLFVEWPVEVVF